MFEDLQEPIKEYIELKKKLIIQEGYIRNRIETKIGKMVPNREELINYLITLIGNQKSADMIAHEQKMSLHPVVPENIHKETSHG